MHSPKATVLMGRLVNLATLFLLSLVATTFVAIDIADAELSNTLQADK
jgi:hypothetical protein